MLSGKYVRKYVNQYTALRTCAEHGFFVENIGITKMNEKSDKSSFKVVKSLVRAANEEEAKKQVARRRRRRRRKPEDKTEPQAES